MVHKGASHGRPYFSTALLSICSFDHLRQSMLGADAVLDRVAAPGVEFFRDGPKCSLSGGARFPVDVFRADDRFPGKWVGSAPKRPGLSPIAIAFGRGLRGPPARKR